MKKISLQKGIEIMLEYSKDNPDIKFKAKWVRKYTKENNL